MGKIIYEHPTERIIKNGMDIQYIEKNKQNFKKLKGIVEEVLKNFRIARNDDNHLIFLVWLMQGTAASLVNSPHGDGFFINRKSILFSPSSITRLRRHFNYKENKYLPTDPDVLRRRRIREEIIKGELK